jgi:hypothetical protein
MNDMIWNVWHDSAWMTWFEMNDIIWMTSFPWTCNESGRHSRGPYLLAKNQVGKCFVIKTTTTDQWDYYFDWQFDFRLGLVLRLGQNFWIVFFSLGVLQYFTQTWRNNSFRCLLRRLPGLKMWDTFACATAYFLTHFIISIAVLENVPPDAGLQKRATFPH